MNYLELSKEVSYILRHEPWKYKLELNADGWVSTLKLINALKENDKWYNITESDLYKMIDLSDKKRHEIVDGKIRALYGHSTPNKVEKVPVEPPDILYHGTAQRFMLSIKRYGLLPQARQYVHLSTNRDIAMQVGRRYDNNPVLLLINSRKAWKNGISFYYGSDTIWLADSIPDKYIIEI